MKNRQQRHPPDDAAGTKIQYEMSLIKTRNPNSFPIRKKVRISFVWWGKVDSNHRSYKQQIYSLSPLATREFPHMKLMSCKGLG